MPTPPYSPARLRHAAQSVHNGWPEDVPRALLTYALELAADHTPPEPQPLPEPPEADKPPTIPNEPGYWWRWSGERWEAVALFRRLGGVEHDKLAYGSGDADIVPGPYIWGGPCKPPARPTLEVLAAHYP